MARDPKRIVPTLKVIEKLWNQYPDMRLGQLIENLASMEQQSNFSIEDQDLVFLAGVVSLKGWKVL